MRRLAIMLCGVTCAVGFAVPAYADGGGRLNGATVTHHRRSGGEDGPRRFRSASDDPPGEGRSHYDREHHDDPSLF
jgi:hypothetical protein